MTYPSEHSNLGLSDSKTQHAESYPLSHPPALALGSRVSRAVLPRGCVDNTRRDRKLLGRVSVQASPSGSLFAVGLGAIPSFPPPGCMWVSWANHSPVGGSPLPELAKACLCGAAVWACGGHALGRPWVHTNLYEPQALFLLLSSPISLVLSNQNWF